MRDTQAMPDERLAASLALARDLEQRDRDVAARLDSLADALRRADDVRARATRVREELAAIPDQIAQAEEDERDARVREVEARREADAAARALDDLRGSRRATEDAKVQAERAARRASTAADDAAAGVERARHRLEALVREEAALQAEAEGLAVEAREVARSVSRVPRISDSGRAVPGGSLAEIDEWAARAHAALFVVRGSLESERERLVLEANGLAAAALGDHGGGSSVALVRRRLEEALAES
jgi:chromosome segregation ATPase